MKQSYGICLSYCINGGHASDPPKESEGLQKHIKKQVKKIFRKIALKSEKEKQEGATYAGSSL